MDRTDKFRAETAAADLDSLDELQPSAWPALDWLDTEGKENQSRKMTFIGSKQFASSCWGPRDPRKRSRFTRLLC